MRKQLIGRLDERNSAAGQDSYLDVECLARVEITSEDAAHPIESALAQTPGPGWRAAQSGEQVIRLLFDEPQHSRRVRLVFDEPDKARTQEFVLSWSADRGDTYREVVRQQYNFCPPTTIHEIEEYEVDLCWTNDVGIARRAGCQSRRRASVTRDVAIGLAAANL
jgi:hypothetical protein